MWLFNDNSAVAMLGLCIVMWMAIAEPLDLGVITRESVAMSDDSPRYLHS